MKWSISKIAKGCKPCSRSFTDGEDVYSTIMMKESNEDNVIETERYDICSSCWEGWHSKENPYWKSHFKEKEEDNIPKLPDRDTVMSLFKEKMESDLKDVSEEEKRETGVLRYLLALMLERKKRLVLCNDQKDKKWEDKIFYKDAKGTDIFQLYIPEMSDEDIRYFQEKLKSLLPLKNKQITNNRQVKEEKPQTVTQQSHDQFDKNFVKE